MTEQHSILSLALEAIPPDGPAIAFKLEVQSPCLEREMLWRCVVLMGAFQRPLRIAGGDPFQALCLRSTLPDGHFESSRKAAEG